MNRIQSMTLRDIFAGGIFTFDFYLTSADQEAKLRLVAETAEEVWGKRAVPA